MTVAELIQTLKGAPLNADVLYGSLRVDVERVTIDKGPDPTVCLS